MERIRVNREDLQYFGRQARLYFEEIGISAGAIEGFFDREAYARILGGSAPLCSYDVKFVHHLIRSEIVQTFSGGCV